MPNVGEKKKVPSALKPSASEDKKLRSIHLSTVQMEATLTHARRSYTETDGQEHVSIYDDDDGGIMQKLGLNNSQWDGVQEKESRA